MLQSNALMRSVGTTTQSESALWMIDSRVAVVRCGTEPLKEELARIAAVRNRGELALEVGRLHGIGVNVLFNLASGQDFKDSTQVIAQADQAGLGLPERDYYFKEDDRSKEIRKEYIKHVAAMFRYVPDARISWRDVRAGALGTALLFVLGRTLIGLYLGKSDPGSVYGAAGSLALVLIWVYYTSMILLLGAEFTKLWAQRYGKGIVPVKGAVAYVEEERKVSEG